MKSLFLLLLSLLLLNGCHKTSSPTHFKGVAMTIPYCIQIGEPLSDQEIEEVQSTIVEIFHHIHAIYDHWNPESEVSQLAHLAAQNKILLSPGLAHFLAFVDTMVKKTGSRFDPTIAPLQTLWKTHLQQGTLPTPDELTPLYEATGWHHVHLEGQLFWKDHDLTALDLGGVAKGYAVDLILEQLQTKGYKSIYVEWGGEIRTSGQHPSGRPWKIGIHGLHSIDLSAAAIATSGTYIQNWTVEGVSYTHIIDPMTGSPLTNSSFQGVSVIAPHCAEADALATALMLFPSKEAAEEWASQHGISIFILENDPIN